ncbi:LptF/LptG family permease [Fulvimarina endophytica]|uniref:LptF/LptG family permease n=1 Tax=Fulvimarina endophytica TaxID=2293836 RepID=A0A371XAF3_9HYPH|nr:LptF/LptG family permease [Fulvimarina endophytica]RFC66205.1 LptF/LptG family permease [Fulvimarina endophytica]
MTLIERYIFRRALVSSAGSLASLALIVWIVQALSRIDIVKTSASAAGNILWIALMLLPNLAAGVVPFAVLLGSIQTLNAMNADSERAVISASGASITLVARPIVLLGFLGGLIMLVIAHGIGPLASKAFYDGIRSVNVDTISVFLRPGAFEQIQSDLVISVGETNGGTIESLFIQDTRDPKLDLTYFAKEAAIVEQGNQSVLMLYDGQLHRKSRESGAISIIEFQTYAFDLSELRPDAGSDWTRSSELTTYQLLNPDLNDASIQQAPDRTIRELVNRFSTWLYCVAFAFWAVAVAGQPQTNRQASNAAMTLGLSGAVALQAVGFIVASNVGKIPGLSILAFAVPLAAILVNILLIRSGTNVSQLPIVQAIVDLPGRIIGAILRSGQRPGRSAGSGSR